MFLWSMKILKIFFKSSISPFPQSTFSKTGTAKATVKWGTCRMSVLTQLRAPCGSHAYYGPELSTKATGHNILACGGHYLHCLQCGVRKPCAHWNPGFPQCSHELHSSLTNEGWCSRAAEWQCVNCPVPSLSSKSLVL